MADVHHFEAKRATPLWREDLGALDRDDGTGPDLDHLGTAA